MKAEHYKFLAILAVITATTAWVSWWLCLAWLVLLVLFFIWANYSTKNDNDEFEQMVLNTLLLEPALTPNQMRGMGLTLMRRNPAQAEFLRHIQIIRDSGRIILKSKNPKTIASRTELINSHFNQLDFSLVSDGTQDQIRNYVIRCGRH